jgi:hypothetical protein
VRELLLLIFEAMELFYSYLWAELDLQLIALLCYKAVDQPILMSDSSAPVAFVFAPMLFAFHDLLHLDI